MENKYTLDTSFLSSLINPEDSNHLKAKAIYEVIQVETLYISSASFAELYFLSTKDFSIEYIEEFIENLLLEIIYFDENLLKFYKSYFKKISKNLSPIDSIIYVSSIYAKSDLITFDKKLLKQFKNSQSH